MARLGMPYYIEQLEYITTILKMLNENGPNIPEKGVEDWYMDVTIRDRSDNSIVGRFSDEIAPDCWEWSEGGTD
jgi:hypothetical protein